ncbi:hypothetical protein [Mesonia mobilis]|uniref:hypothetical protein n=1 Tax=Mesonia mobilis TaxID=369791 RepID=UPI0024BA6E00|nr:hypothetical protein [Mesonia mobilis]
MITFYSIIIFTGIAGSLITYYLNNHLKWGAVLASAFPSLLVGLFFYFFPFLVEENLAQQIPVVFIGASFVGMVSNKVLHHPIYVILAGLIFSIIYLNKAQFFNHFGGALGTSACIAVVAAIGLATVIQQKGFRKKKKEK